jgi:RND family efflux transporter MFP subunit
MDHPQLKTQEAALVQRSPRTGQRMLQIGIALGALALLLAAWRLLSTQQAAGDLKVATEAQSVVSVAVTAPQPLTSSSDVVLPGNVQANYEAPIYARTSGYLKRWLVDIGARVKAGQLLAEIESPEVDQQLRQAQADLATAQANEKLAQVTAERWRNLRATDSVSKQEADEKISAADASRAQVQAAGANVQRLRELTGFQRIIAPFDGVITARRTDIGQLINAGSGTGPELFRIADVRKLRLYVSVPQSYAAQMQPGISAQLVFPDRPGKSYTATLDSTSGAIDSTTRTLLAQLMVDNQSGELLPGAYTEVHFNLPSAARNSFKVPANVLLFRADGLHVATVGPDGRVVLKTVSIGRDYGSDIEVVDGLVPEDKVILSPPDSLTAGVPVRVVTPTPSSAAQSP